MPIESILRSDELRRTIERYLVAESRDIYHLARVSWTLWANVYGAVVASLRVDYLRFEAEIDFQFEQWGRYQRPVRCLTIYNNRDGIILGDPPPWVEDEDEALALVDDIQPAQFPWWELD